MGVQMNNFTIEFAPKAQKQIKKLPETIFRKFKRQVQYLIDNPAHPSLRVKRKGGSNDFEARIDYHYRFTFIKKENTICILTIGPHDEGLGKK